MRIRAFPGLALAIGSALLSGIPIAARAIDYAVSVIEYRNGGEYPAGLTAKYRLQVDGQAEPVLCNARPAGTIHFVNGHQAMRITLTNRSSYRQRPGGLEAAYCEDIYGRPEMKRGTEIWGVIEDRDGTIKDCRQNEDRFYFHPDGGWLAYTTSGASLEGAQCTIALKPTTGWTDMPGE